MLKKIALFFKLFLFFFLTFLNQHYSFAIFGSSNIQNTLNSMTVANASNLSTFNNNVINSSSMMLVTPGSGIANSIYDKMQFFYDARITQNANYQKILLQTLSNAQGRACFVFSGQVATISMWFNTVASESMLYNNFPKFLATCTTPSQLLTNIVQSTSYNTTYYQDYPYASTSVATNSIFAMITSFFNNRTANLQTNINFLQDLLNLLNAANGKKFLTNVENTSVISWITTVSNEQSTLYALLTNFNNYLTTYKNNPVELNAYIISNTNYSQPYLQDYPDPKNSIYAILNYLFTSRETMYLSDKNFLTNLQSALINAKTKSFLTAAQQTDVTNLAATVAQDITLINGFNSAFSGATTVAQLKTIIPTYNRSYFQNAPSTTSNIYTKIQTFFNQRSTAATQPDPTKRKADLIALQSLLAAAQNKFFLPSTKITDINLLHTTVTNEVSNIVIPSAGSESSSISGSAESITPTFIFDPSKYGNDSIVYNAAAWMAPNGSEGNFAVKFKARGQKDLYVQLSPNPSATVGNVYNLNIGGNNNSLTWVRNFTTAGATTLIIGNQVLNSSALITGGLPGDGSTWDDYWVKIENNKTLSFGKGQTVGTNEAVRWTFAKPLDANVRYVGFGGYSNIIQFCNIQTIANDQSIAIKSKFATDLGAATTIDGLLVIINNLEYNKTYLQNYPNETSNSIFTKIQGLVNSRTDPLNKNVTYYTNLKNLLISAKDKNFVSTSQNTVIIALIATIDSELNSIFITKPQPPIQPIVQPSPPSTDKFSRIQTQDRGPTRRRQVPTQRNRIVGRQRSTINVY
ncbi:MAG: hypothetical protein US49_C0011G0003 [candidate division TM6 bacterium GW2011_GWF2_37_49]|nr:MAG: hypothetical protein US49_C0011G0003 [candidate division TM6 bacterium GW2011_GWF2_37_49]